jgi:hypothetical protein
MKFLTILMLIVASPALAQIPQIPAPEVAPGMSVMPPGPRTVPFNDAAGTQIGTATFTGNRIYLRDMQSELIAQIVIDRDGTQTMLDPSGKVLDRLAPGEQRNIRNVPDKLSTGNKQ